MDFEIDTKPVGENKDGKAKELWSNISEEWVHIGGKKKSSGFAKKFREFFDKGKGMPNWFFSGVGKYTYEDLSEETAGYIEGFIEILEASRKKIGAKN